MLKENEQSKEKEFVVSRRPIVPREMPSPSSRRASNDYENLGELPRSYGEPVLFAIARDPHALFIYWDIDWQNVFGGDPPPDRKVRLRVFSDDGIEETSVTAEPLAGNACVAVSGARSSYRVELGYEQREGAWNSIAISDAVRMPPDDIAEGSPVDVATVPFHLSFQRLINVFRGSKYDGDALVEILARLQTRADDPGGAALTEVERELLRAVDWSLSGTEALQRSRLREAADSFAARRRIEAILGFGASSWMR